uniref:Putative secreted protein n=1 Tax=Anopheles darlingi TaxID=43151 RepID=A0A2M4DHF0_ANODA
MSCPRVVVFLSLCLFGCLISSSDLHTPAHLPLRLCRNTCAAIEFPKFSFRFFFDVTSWLGPAACKLSNTLHKLTLRRAGEYF